MKKAFRIIVTIVGIALGVLLTIKVGNAGDNLNFWQYFLIGIAVVPFTTLTYISFVELWDNDWEILGAIVGIFFELFIVYYFILLVIVIGRIVFKTIRLFF